MIATGGTTGAFVIVRMQGEGFSAEGGRGLRLSVGRRQLFYFVNQRVILATRYLILPGWGGVGLRERIPRQLRIEYERAIYHVMSRGDLREPIFEDDKDRETLLKTLAQACEKAEQQEI